MLLKASKKIKIIRIIKKKHKPSLKNASSPRALPLPFSLCILLKYLGIMIR